MLLRVAKLLWMLSMPAFLGLATYIYVYLPDNVRLIPSVPNTLISKSLFFYGLIGAMLFINYSLNVAGGLLALLPSTFLPIPKRTLWTQSIFARKALAKVFKNWFRGLLLFINAFLIFSATQVYVTNTPDTIVNVATAFYVLIVFVVAWLCYFPFAFSDTSELS